MIVRCAVSMCPTRGDCWSPPAAVAATDNACATTLYQLDSREALLSVDSTIALGFNGRRLCMTLILYERISMPRDIIWPQHVWISIDCYSPTSIRENQPVLAPCPIVAALTASFCCLFSAVMLVSTL